MVEKVAAANDEMEHSPLGASSIERGWNCAGWINLCLQHGIPFSGTAGRDAAYGTLAHQTAATFLLQYLGEDTKDRPSTQIMSKHEIDGHSLVIDEELLDGVSTYVDFIVSRIKKYGMKPWQCKVEERVQIPTDKPLRYPLRGSADNMNYVPLVRQFVDDLKFGVEPVKVDNNKQLLQYALGALHALPEDERDEIPVIEVNIIQPRLIGAENGGISTFEMATKDLLEWGEELKVRAAATEDPNAPREAGAWCKYCPAKNVCPEYDNKEEAKFIKDFALVKVEQPVLSLMSNDQLFAIQCMAPEISRRLKEVNSLIGEKLRNGEKVGDLKLVQKRADRQWTNPTNAARTLGAFLGDDIFTPRELKTPAQIEKLIKSKRSTARANKKLGKGEDFEVPKDLVLDAKKEGSITYTPKNGVAIARGSDSRPAINREEVFDVDFADIEI